MEDNYCVENPEVIGAEENNLPKENNTLGVAGLVTGILGVIFAVCCSPLGVLLGIVALICGIIAAGREQKFAVAAIVLGAIALVLGILISVFIMPLVFLGFMEGLSQEVITGY